MSLHELIEWAVSWFRAQAWWLVPLGVIALGYAFWPRRLSHEERLLRDRLARQDAEDRAAIQRAGSRDLLALINKNKGRPPGR
jgi:hypothetical protein